jgi:4-amino-4-deoxy-L-arabinose transferase-like glycosyltransferase
LYKLDGVGVLSPDEPRYAAAGRAMALNHDWITPRLWGKPWFEKPALLYWMTAIGTDLGLNRDLAGRLPVAILSLAFLAVWFLLLKAEFGLIASAIATATVGTSAAWFIYSSLCLTDVPMAAFFSLGVVLTLRLIRGDESKGTWIALGACIGLAVLAKGFVPLVLCVPLLWFLKDRWRDWWIALLAFVLVAGPWYFLVIQRNGYAFIDVFFFQQQFTRLYSKALQHVQPVYFYVWIIPLAIFPWTPVLFTLKPALLRGDRRLLCLAAVFAFGFVFFSVSLNKLPGYVLPLLPSLLALAGVSAAQTVAWRRRPYLIGCAALVAITPLIGPLVPALLTSKVNSAAGMGLTVLPVTLSMLILFVTPLALAAFANRQLAAALLVMCFALAAIEVRSSIYPVLDEQASPRGFWREIAGISNEVCDAGLHRAWEYGLAFYRDEPIPICDQSPRPVRLVQNGEHRAEKQVNGKLVP